MNTESIDTTTKTLTLKDRLSETVHGRYADSAKELANDVKRLFGWTDDECVKLATNYCCELGRYLVENGNKGVKIGDKISKDGKVTLREITQAVKGVTLTESLRVAKAVSLLNDASKWGAKIKQAEYVEA